MNRMCDYIHHQRETWLKSWINCYIISMIEAENLAKLLLRFKDVPHVP